jgi:acyl dehydratase
LKGISVGDVVSRRRVFTLDDMAQFRALHHDHNPIHHDVAYAASTPLKRPIVPLVMYVGMISSILAGDLKVQAWIDMGQTIPKNPAFLGEEVISEVRIVDIIPKPHKGFSILQYHGTVCVEREGSRVVMLEQPGAGTVPIDAPVSLAA